jgi:DNA invertase Pin-like site-specific DNA recombinase
MVGQKRSFLSLTIYPQSDSLSEAGAERIFSETLSGASRKRPELERLIDQLRGGDVVVVTKYDRALPVPCVIFSI